MESMETFGKVFDGIKFRKGLTLTFCFDQDMLTSKVIAMVTSTPCPAAFIATA